MNLLHTIRIQAECLLTLVGADCSVATTRRQLHTLDAFLMGRNAITVWLDTPESLALVLSYLNTLPSPSDRLLVVKHALKLLTVLAESQCVGGLISAPAVA